MKRITALLLSLAMTFVLCSCDKAPGDVLDTDETNKESVSGKAEESGDTSCADFMEIMREIKSYGDRTAELELPVNSEYYYSFAGASTSALRYAVEYILWLKGEGESLAQFTANSLYKDWSTIAEINYASPYPCYFEGMLLEVQGRYEEALELYANASVMDMFPEGGLDFYYLKYMTVEALYDLRDDLRALEDEIYSAYRPRLTGREWDKYLFDDEYIMAVWKEMMDASDFENALWYAKQALKVNPFNESSWSSAALSAVYTQDWEQAGAYIDEGLTVFPEDEVLNGLKQMFIDAAKGVGLWTE